MKTTIQIDVSTLEKLKELKNFRESYDFILNRLIEESQDDQLYPEEIEEIQEALEEVKRGETVSFEDVLKENGIIL